MQGADETHNPGSSARERGKPFTPTISARFKAQLIRRWFEKQSPRRHEGRVLRYLKHFLAISFLNDGAP